MRPVSDMSVACDLHDSLHSFQFCSLCQPNCLPGLLFLIWLSHRFSNALLICTGSHCFSYFAMSRQHTTAQSVVAVVADSGEVTSRSPCPGAGSQGGPHRAHHPLQLAGPHARPASHRVQHELGARAGLLHRSHLRSCHAQVLGWRTAAGWLCGRRRQVTLHTHAPTYPQKRKKEWKSLCRYVSELEFLHPEAAQH